MLIDLFIPALALGVIAVKFDRRFRDNCAPEGYTLHAIYWLGLLPSEASSITLRFIIYSPLHD
jgi:conjugal transfer pilus assembly protein TraL